MAYVVGRFTSGVTVVTVPLGNTRFGAWRAAGAGRVVKRSEGTSFRSFIIRTSGIHEDNGGMDVVAYCSASRQALYVGYDAALR